MLNVPLCNHLIQVDCNDMEWLRGITQAAFFEVFGSSINIRLYTPEN